MPSLEALSIERVVAMREAGREIRECERVLRKVGRNVVADILHGQGTFYELDHYPKGDVYDSDSHAQYYYHAHRKDSGEHGHFHTFMRATGMPVGVRPLDRPGSEPGPQGEQALAHLIAISMDQRGRATHLFTTNRWVTGESWYAGEDVIAMLDRFVIDHAYPSWPTNRWLGAMMVLFRPVIEELVHERDRRIAAWQAEHPGADAFADRALEITSIREIAIEEQIAAVEQALMHRERATPVH